MHSELTPAAAPTVAQDSTRIIALVTLAEADSHIDTVTAQIDALEADLGSKAVLPENEKGISSVRKLLGELQDMRMVLEKMVEDEQNGVIKDVRSWQKGASVDSEGCRSKLKKKVSGLFSGAKR